jgi:YD repeat-containing protein
VSAGYRITAVKDAANGNTVESYAFDNGGRLTTITRDSATWNLGYNSADQVTAVTNGASWFTYRH